MTLPRRAVVKALTLALLAIGSAVLPSGRSALAQERAGPIRIGSFLAITGDGAFLGAPALATLQLYVDLVNGQGGVMGRRLELVYYDVGIDMRTAQSVVRRLIEIDKVDLIIGGSTTGATMAVLPIVAEAKIPLIALAGSNLIVDPVRRWVFQTAPSDRLACAKIFEDLKKRNLRRIALISGDGGFGQSMHDQCVGLATHYGLTIASDKVYPSDTHRIIEPLERIREAKGVEAVVNIDFGSAPPYLAQLYRKMGFKAPLYQTHAQATPDYLARAENASDGIRMPVPLIALTDRLGKGNSVARVLLAYREAYRTRWDVEPSVYGSHAHDALLLAVSALARAGTTDKEAVRRALEATDGLVGAGGVYRMSADDHTGLDLAAFRMVEVRSGSWVLIE